MCAEARSRRQKCKHCCVDGRNFFQQCGGRMHAARMWPSSNNFNASSRIICHCSVTSRNSGKSRTSYPQACGEEGVIHVTGAFVVLGAGYAANTREPASTRNCSIDATALIATKSERKEVLYNVSGNAQSL